MGSAVAEALADEGALFSRGGEGADAPTICETKPFVMWANGVVSYCDSVCCVDYRKITNGFVLARIRYGRGISTEHGERMYQDGNELRH